MRTAVAWLEWLYSGVVLGAWAGAQFDIHRGRWSRCGALGWRLLLDGVHWVKGRVWRAYVATEGWSA